MILSCAQMKQAEDAAFSAGASAEGLMEQAGLGIARVVASRHPHARQGRAYVGKGHNGGDALVAARYLVRAGWTFEIELAYPEDSLAPLTRKMLDRLRDELPGNPVTPLVPTGPVIQLDGLLGLGASGMLKAPLADLVRHMNARRRSEGAVTVAMDLPSGLQGDTGVPGDPCVEADLTLPVGFVKSGLVADAAINHVGRLVCVPLPELSAPPGEGDPADVVTARSVGADLPPRPFDTHKGTAGRVGIVAGSTGLLGAARLCSAAAVKAGAGLITLFVPEKLYPIAAAACLPEVMVHPLTSYREIFSRPLHALAVGPGLGSRLDPELVDGLREFSGPVVLDADALNGLARHPEFFATPAGPRLLTPHPGEMERLSPQGTQSRREWAEGFVRRNPVTLLLKGARTLIAEAGCPTRFNSTGDPGMATGGMGDVLTGVCAALIGQGLPPRAAAAAGAWLCGRAAELARNEKVSEESLCAEDILANLGAAFLAAKIYDPF